MFTTIFLSSLVLIAYGLPVEIAKPTKQVNPELLGGGFEGDMILPPGFDPLHPNRGVSINGQIRRWPNKIVPYDISAISDSRDRQTIELAMQKLMYDTGITKPGQTSRTSCVTFRPAQSTDRKVLKIQYSTGCSASVSTVIRVSSLLYCI
ncbi:unnamed protein product [Rotaria sordida]|uniref:Uncharacterized protein n=1 Tax=Rotaria sordida TaxID=392033 RepID=A0A814FQ95_9BILA|nr:unnamed protein product [Rotaria sordida]